MDVLNYELPTDFSSAYVQSQTDQNNDVAVNPQSIAPTDMSLACSGPAHKAACTLYYQDPTEAIQGQAGYSVRATTRSSSVGGGFCWVAHATSDDGTSVPTTIVTYNGVSEPNPLYTLHDCGS